MHFKKILSAILALSVSTAVFSIPASAEKVSYDFEGDNSAWYNGGEGDGTMVTNVINQDVTEDGNTFRRLGFDIAVTGSDNQVGDVRYMPSATIVLDEPIPFVEGQTIKISSKIRSNQFGSNYRVMPGIAMNIPEKAYKKEVIETLTGGVHAWNKFFNTIYKVDYSSNGSKVFHMASGNSQWGATAGLNWGAYWMIPSSDQVSGNLSANTWYKVDSYLTIAKIDDVAKIEKVRTVVNDGELGDVETIVNSSTKYGKVSLQNETSLQSLHLFTGWRSPAGAKTGVTVDFDDITIDVIVKGNIALKSADLVDGNAEYYLKSDIPIDNPEEIYIHDGMGGSISTSAEYDEDTGIITVRANEEMTEMTYAISGLDKLTSNGAIVEAIEDIAVGVPEKMPIDEEFDVVSGFWMAENDGNITASNGEMIYKASDYSYISRVINSGMGILLGEDNVTVKTSFKKQGEGEAKLQLNRIFMGGNNYDSVVTVSDSEIKIGDEVVATGEFTGKKIDVAVNVTDSGKRVECYVIPEGDKAYAKIIELANVNGKLAFVGFESKADLAVDYVYIAPSTEISGKVFLEGLAETGEKITATLNCAENETAEYTINWMAADSANGSYSVIEGASGLKFNVPEEYDGKFIKVVAISADGEEAESNIISKRLAPIAENVEISGERYTGEVLTGSYDFSDPNMDNEGETTFRWLRSSSEKGTYEAIDGATEITYTLTADDIGKWLKLEVTPVSENEPATGDAVESDAFKGSVLPEAKNVKITKAAGMYTGNYTYYHEWGAAEGDTKYEWFADGELVSEEISYKPSAKDKKLVFRVTPVSEKAPYEGEAVEVSVSVAKSSGGGSSGGGGSTPIVSGSTAQSLIQKVEEETRENVKQEELEKEPVIDVLGHWSEEYVKNVVGNDIMPVDSQKYFYPDKMVTRAEIITYLFKTMDYSETAYNNEFADVSADAEYAGKLQTFVDKGIISKDVNFRPNDNVSRQEVCKILSIMLGMGESDVNLDKYIDKDQIGDWAVKHIKNMISAGIMIGVSESEFSPKTNITNAQMAKIITVIMSGVDVNAGNNQVETVQESIDLSSDNLKVAFIGGSLTELGETWQQMTIDALKEKLPGKKITFINKGLGGTGSGYGAARFENDILSYEPDIVFIGFATNDKNSDEVNAKRYMEQMVRMCIEAEKQPAVVFVYKPSPTDTLQNKLENWQNGVNWKSEVADHYGIKTVNVHEYIMNDYEQQKETHPTYTLTQYYIDNSWKQTGEDSFDVHGGYIKYGEAIEKAIDEDFEAFIRKPKNVGVYCKENETVTDYEIIKVDDSKLKFTGEWTKCENGYKPNDSELTIRQLHLDYFEKGLMQNSKGNASFEFSTDAASVNLQIISSKIGNSATVYVDGVETGKVVTKNTNAGMNYSTGWIDLPNDGKEHLVKYEVDNDAENYVFTLGSVMLRRYR